MLNPYPSTALKSALLDMIFEECGRAGYDFSRTPDEDVSTLRRVDAMMAQWEAEGIALNYNFPAQFGQGQPTDALGIPDSAIDTVAAWAAYRIAPGMGKSMSAESRKAMADGKAFLRAETATIPSMLLPRSTARGSGHKPWSTWYPFETEKWDDSGTLVDASVAQTTCLATDGYACSVVFTQGALLSLDDDAGGLFTLTGSILTGTGLTAGIVTPVVLQAFPGAPNNMLRTPLPITVS